MSSQAFTKEAVLRRMESRDPGILVYNPSQIWVPIQHAGIMYHLTPDLPGETTTHPVTGAVVPANGVTVIHGRYGRMLDVFTKRPGPHGPIPGQSSFDIASFFIDMHGERGLIWLEGDDKDEARKAAAKRIHAVYHKEQAEMTVKARAVYATNWEKSHPGQRVPPATRVQKLAQKFLDELSIKGEKLGRYVCKYNCTDTDDLNEFIDHMKAAHNEGVEGAMVRKVLQQVADESPAANSIIQSEDDDPPLSSYTTAAPDVKKATTKPIKA